MDNIPLQILNSTAKKIGVSAGPGAGKTSEILLPKLRSILERSDVDPREVLLLTFSRISAADLKSKVASMDRAPRATTVHGYALSFLLSEDNHDMRKRVSNILLQFERETLLSDLKLSFPDIGRRELRKLLELFSAAWAQTQTDEVFNENAARQAFKHAVVNWLTEYEAAMMEEIMYHAVDLGKQLNDAILIARPQFIIVDEFQDLNKLEQEFVSLLARESALLLVAGDPDQSIYSFKFAHPDGIREFGSRSDVESYQWSVSKRCPKKVLEIANQLLRQADPTRTQFVDPLPGAPEGSVRFVRKEYQSEEFEDIVANVADQLDKGATPDSIMILVPRRKLGKDFAGQANLLRAKYNIPDNIDFRFASTPEFTSEEQERILLFALLVNPDSVLHLRVYLGLGDSSHCANEIAQIKARYGSLRLALAQADPSVCSGRQRRLKAMCSRVTTLRSILEAERDLNDVDAILNELFPPDVERFAVLRRMVIGLKENSDNLEDLYYKFLDELRSVPNDEHIIRVMTIMGSKGLDADHVYILGCNASNIPGTPRSEYLSDLDYRNEQLRLLFVGTTRTKKTLQISWSRYLPYQQIQSQRTPSIRIVKKGGETYGMVGISEFLQAIPGIHWVT